MKYGKPELAVLDAACAVIRNSSGSKEGPSYEVDFALTAPAYEADE